MFIGGRTYTAPKSSTPEIDGVVNAAEYEGAKTIVLNRHTGSYHIGVGNDEWEDGDHSLTAWVVHDDEAIYVGIDAVDDQIFTDTAEAGSEDGQTWVDDSVEIFFDADESNLAGRDLEKQFEGQYVLTPNGARRDNEANNPSFGETGDWFAATTETDEGYQMEFRVTKASLGIADDASVGFNIAMNDDDGAGRKSQLNWNGSPHNEFTYGVLVLGPAGSDGGDNAADVSISIANGMITLTWEGNGSLETAPAVTGPWTAIDNAASGISVEASASEAFYRVR